MTKQEFIDLLQSGCFRIKTPNELDDEGYEYFLEEDDYYNGIFAIDREALVLIASFVKDGGQLSSEIDEISNDCFSIKSDGVIHNSYDNIDCYWFPFDIIKPMDSYIEPIHLDIPDEKFILIL